MRWSGRRSALSLNKRVFRRGAHASPPHLSRRSCSPHLTARWGAGPEHARGAGCWDAGQCCRAGVRARAPPRRRSPTGSACTRKCDGGLIHLATLLQPTPSPGAPPAGAANQWCRRAHASDTTCTVPRRLRVARRAWRVARGDAGGLWQRPRGSAQCYRRARGQCSSNSGLRLPAWVSGWEDAGEPAGGWGGGWAAVAWGGAWVGWGRTCVFYN